MMWIYVLDIEHTKIPGINIYVKYNYSTTMCRTFSELLVQCVTNTTE
jgi:hypothetical protein